MVVFQFQLSFQPSEDNKRHVEWCRANLHPDYQMAIEFRHRGWVRDEAAIQSTVQFARGLGCALVAEDDLEHEVVGRFTPLAATDRPIVRLPIILRVAAPIALYIRLHRRQGKQRVLEAHEFEEWVQRFQQAREHTNEGEGGVRLEGPIWFLIGTDWEDQPVINSNLMQKALERGDEKRRREYEERVRSNSNQAAETRTAIAAPAAASSSATVTAAAAAGSPPPSSSPLPPPPEPLCFDYKSYYRTHLTRLPASFSSNKQASLAHFFGKKDENSSTAAS
jgi:hypothetical protein